MQNSHSSRSAASPLVLNRAQVRRLDQRAVEQYGMTSLVLMENAGRGCVDALVELGVAGPVLICCGAGNNGGDGFVMARHLDLRGFEVRIALFRDAAALRGDAAANYHILIKAGFEIDTIIAADDLSRLRKLLEDADWVVDALLGTGAVGPPRPPLGSAIELLNSSAAKKLAIDIPSGLDCDSGLPAETVFRADHTFTLAALKPGLLEKSARDYVGKLRVIDIGAPRRLLEEAARERE